MNRKNIHMRVPYFVFTRIKISAYSHLNLTRLILANTAMRSQKKSLRGMMLISEIGFLENLNFEIQ